jgi:hypothetical protein
MITTVSGMATPGATIQVLSGGAVIGTTTAAQDGSYSVGVTLAPGPNTLSVSQTVNGETSALSGVVYNVTPSAPKITTPAAASAQRSSSITVGGWAVPAAVVVLLDNGAVLGSATADANGIYAIPATLSTGQNKLATTASVGGIVGAPSAVSTVRIDDDPPVFLSPPTSLTAYAPTKNGAAVSWPALSAYDAQDGQVVSTCNPASGSTFALGSTTVSCSASDTLGNEASISFAVNVVLQQPPTLQLPPGKEIIVKSAIATGANVSFDVTATNDQGAPIAATCAPASGSFFPAGTTRVTCTASDSVAQAAASDTFDVTVIPVLYYGGDAGTNADAPTAASAGGGCNAGGAGGTGDCGALIGVGLVVAAANRRRKAKCAD